MVRLEDRTLLARHVDGDRAAFSALLDRLGGSVYTTLRRLGVAEPDRDDAFQEVFVRVHRAARSYDPSRPLRPWVMTIAVNVARTWHRRRAVRAMVFADGGHAASSAMSTAPSAEGLVGAAEVAAWLEEAIVALPAAHREAVVLVMVEGLSAAEAADAAGVPVATLKTRLHRGRVALAKGLACRGHGPGVGR